MITIAELRIKNFHRYRGEHRIKLSPTVYGIVAKWETEPNRSNWAGKTSFLEAIAFALEGTTRGVLAAEITKGETECEVEVTLAVDDRAVVIERRIAAGRSSVLTVRDGEELRRGKEAQAHIDNLLCLSERDFFATSYVAQKKMARLIQIPSAERMKLVAEWLQLQPLEDACDLARARMASEKSALTEAEVRLEIANQTLGQAAQVLSFPEKLPTGEFLAYADGQIAEQIEAMHTAKGIVQMHEDHRDRAVANARDAEDAKEFHKIAEEGRRLLARLQKVDEKSIAAQLDSVQAKRAQVQAEIRVIQHDCQALSRWAVGNFNGKCPTFEIDCPAKNQINDACADGQAKIIDKAAQKQALIKSLEVLSREIDTTASVQYGIEHDRVELESCKRAAARLKEAAIRLAKSPAIPSTVGAIDIELNEARTAYANESAKLATFRRERENVVNIFATIDNLHAVIEKMKSALELSKEAVQVLGREGAQRELGRRMMGEIEQSANAALVDCGIDLSVSVSWAREADGLAKHCNACGETFPSSERVKECPKCHEPRGPNVVNKLEITLSDQSGAADDLAGVAIQLAAMTWLRNTRQSPWGVVFLDEPFGALDRQNRQALAVHLGSMLGSRYGVTQAFVVAHDPSIMDALPGRVEVTAGVDGSSVVVAGEQIADEKSQAIKKRTRKAKK